MWTEADVDAVASAVMFKATRMLWRSVCPTWVSYPLRSPQADGYGEEGLVTVSEMKSFLPGTPYEAFGEWVTDIKNWTQLASNEAPRGPVRTALALRTSPVPKSRPRVLCSTGKSTTPCDATFKRRSGATSPRVAPTPRRPPLRTHTWPLESTTP